jgi:hypothetical protein
LQGFLFEIDEAEIVVHEADDPNTVIDLLDAKALTGEDGRDIEPLAMHADAAAVGDEDVAVMQWVCEVGQAGVGSRTRRVDFGWTLHGERLVWPFGIEFLNKVVEAGLLLQTVHSGRSGCFFLQCEMHAFMPAVLLWMARLDALDGDAEPQPPHREFGEIEEAVWTGERHAIVGPDRLRQAALLEELLEGSDGKVLAIQGLRRAGESARRGR